MLNQTPARLLIPDSRVHYVFRLFSIIALVMALLLTGVGPVGADDGQVRLDGYVPAELTGRLSSATTMLFGPAEREREMEISLALNPRNYSELTALSQAQADPNSLHYHSFLSQADFINRFSPTQADYDATLQWLKDVGLKITHTYPNRMLVDASGSATTIAAAFGTGFGTFTDKANGKTSFGVTANPTVPASLASKINYIGGLTSRKFFHTDAPQIPGNLERSTAEQRRRDGGFTPPQIRAAYGAEELSKAGFTGKGVTIGILLFDAYFQQSDIDGFSNLYGLPKKNVNVVGNLAPPGSPTYEIDGYLETLIDLQWAHAVAPDAELFLYSQVVNTDGDYLRIFQSFANDNRADIASLSFGGPESLQPPELVKAIDTAMLQGVVQGSSIFVAAGNSGIYGEARFRQGDPNKVVASYPATAPFVTAVGGTTLKLNPDNTIASESGWSLGPDSGREKASASGGRSIFYERPSYQRNFAPDGRRGVPDVVANASPETPYNLYFDPRFAGSSLPPGAYALGAGTSNATPVWAGFGAQLVQQFGGRLGLLNPVLYDLNFTAHRDILQGFNGESARPGYDFMSGLGAPRVDILSRFFPSRAHSAPLPPGATVFERINPNVSVVPGGTFTVIVGFRNNTDVPMNNPTVNLPLPAGARLVEAKFTGGGASIASQNENSATLNYGSPIPPYQNATGFITIQAPDAPVGTVITHRSSATWNQGGQQITLGTNAVDLSIANAPQTDNSQDGLLGGFLTKDEGSGDFILRDTHFAPGENWSASIVDAKGNAQAVPDGRIAGGAADGEGKIEVRIFTKTWPSGAYSLLIRGNTSGLEVVANFNS